MTFLILICTLPERADKLRRLTRTLDRQKANYKIHDAGRSMTTGMKRNQLIEQSSSDYFAFVDDDDLVTDNYYQAITDAIQSGPDVVTFCGYMTTNGAQRKGFTIKLDSKYEEKDNHFYRFPNHLCAFKRQKVQHIKFPDQHVQEDYQWAKMIHDRKILKTEVHIPQELYWYDFDAYKKSYARPVRVR